MATLTFNGRLPGVVCQTALPPAGEEPLRLDVAAFVGFAERGPLHTPVALEDLGQYRALFGSDLLVARDGGRPVYAHLPQAVQAFFDNGGRRCYVVRVAGAGARPNRFPLPGLVAWSEDDGFRAVATTAAWVGRWSDTMSVGAQLRSRPLPFRGDLSIVGDTVALIVEAPTDVSLAVGDVLRVAVGAGCATAELLLPMAAVRPLGPAASAARGVPYRVEARRAAVHAFTLVPPEAEPVPRRVERLGELGWELLTAAPTGLTLDSASGEWRLSLPPTTAVGRRHLLRVATEGGREAMFPVEQVWLHGGPDDMSPPGEPLLVASSSQVRWVAALEELGSPEGDVDIAQVELLTFDLALREGEEAAETWSELRFNPGPRYWADVLAVPPAEAAGGEGGGHLALVGAGGPEGSQVLNGGNRSLRLAAPFVALTAPPPFFLPLGMAPVLTVDGFLGALPDPDPAGKDGLDAFDPPALFLDGRLARCGVRDLVNEADRLLLLDPAARLTGLHSLLPVEEVALVAIPDLVHRPWPAAIAPLPLPELPEPPRPRPPDWAQFQPCPQPLPDVELTPRQVVQAFYTAFQRQGDEAARQFLTEALQEALAESPLSAVLQVERPPDSCDVDAPPCRPGPGVPVTVRGTLHFVGEADVSHVFTLVHRPGGWRIDAIEPQTAWRASVGLSPRALAGLPAVRPAEAYDVAALLAVHEALVTLCAARADALAVLSLPEHFQRREVLAWAQQLRASGNLTESNALSYAAVYHPWLQTPERVTPELAPLRAAPPDGAVCGMIAARELARGPWIAPANVPLRGVVGLIQAVGEADALALFDAQANLLRQQQGTFSPLSAHTLSLDRLLVQVSVRRLLIFLRKLALRRGMRYVFEPNNERFRRRVEAAFERTLTALTAQGALTAFQVVTGEGLNTPNDVDNGRFLIALKVAPSLPIEFITVMLVRAGEGVLRAVEA
ncbi:MAG: hypothetical protein NZ528_07875 [Caldilineales bacterium]|nr:hypothetical protein [Caldilineales bacterium]MDW8318324.1 hypothetical protein [Anaerolineae bacterium]